MGLSVEALSNSRVTHQEVEREAHVLPDSSVKKLNVPRGERNAPSQLETFLPYFRAGMVPKAIAAEIGYPIEKVQTSLAYARSVGLVERPTPKVKPLDALLPLFQAGMSAQAIADEGNFTITQVRNALAFARSRGLVERPTPEQTREARIKSHATHDETEVFPKFQRSRRKDKEKASVQDEVQADVTFEIAQSQGSEQEQNEMEKISTQEEIEDRIKKLLAEHGQYMNTTAVFFTQGNFQDAEEIVSDIARKVAERNALLPEKAHGYLYTLIKHASIDRRRMEQRHNGGSYRLDLSRVGEGSYRVAPSAEKEVFDKITFDEVIDHAKRYEAKGEKDKGVVEIVRSKLAGQSLRKIALDLGISPGTVTSRFERWKAEYAAEIGY